MDKTKNKTEHARVLVTEASYDRMEPVCAKVIESLDLGGWYGGLSGKTVFIKPNMLGLFEPEHGATTHPLLVRSLVDFFREAGAEVTVGDNCGIGGYGLNQRVAKMTGIMESAAGAYKNVASETKMVDLDSKYMPSIVVSKAMLEADILVNVPKMKTHSLTVVTGAVKNMFGIVAGAGKGRSHASAPGVREFGKMLADLYAIRPPDLTVMDGIVAMEGNGPSSGKIKPLGKVLASTNAVALDAVMCRIMGYPPQDVHHLRNAANRGYGPIEPEAIELTGDRVQSANFKLPLTIQRFRLIGRFLNERIMGSLVKSKLVLNEKLCEKCKICVQGCPVGAMQMPDWPRIDEDKCIKCMCCQELCPESAWAIGGLMRRFQASRG